LNVRQRGCLLADLLRHVPAGRLVWSGSGSGLSRLGRTPVAVAVQQTCFTPALFDFLRELGENNNRPWFEANRRRYEDDVRGPLARFVAEFAPHLHAISAEFVADPRPVGGSIFRIYRDTRFSKDKTPYKTNAGAHFRHSAGSNVHAPGFYLHLAPGEVFMACGVWQPDAPTLGRVRDAIVARADEWEAIKDEPAFRQVFSIGGDQLARPPRGYDPGHRLIEDLRRKDFVVTAPFSQAEACAPEFLERYAATCRTAAPFVRFLTEAVGQPW
jgi:uncharacterized protein (TIGR02453 family)